MNPQHAHWFILILVNIPVYLGLGRLIFKDWSDFMDTLRLWSSMDWIMSLQKQWHEDPRETGKLPLFLLLCIVLIVGEHLMFGKAPARPAIQAVKIMTPANSAAQYVATSKSQPLWLGPTPDFAVLRMRA